jgi:hypothetical protein
MTAQPILPLFDAPSLDCIPRLKAAMRDALKACPLSRTRVVADMLALAEREGINTGLRGLTITEDVLNQWVAPSADQHVICLRLLPLFCRAVNSVEPLAALAGAIGATVIGDEDRKLLAWAKAETQRRKAHKTARRLAEEVGL